MTVLSFVQLSKMFLFYWVYLKREKNIKMKHCSWNIIVHQLSLFKVWWNELIFSLNPSEKQCWSCYFLSHRYDTYQSAKMKIHIAVWLTFIEVNPSTGLHD